MDGRSRTSKDNGKKGGRKKGFAALEAEKARALIAQKLTKAFGPIVDKAITQAIEGNKDARDWLTERAYGKVPQAMVVPDGSGQIIVTWQSQPTSKSPTPRVSGQ